MIITKAANRAQAFRTTIFLGQISRTLPFGNVKALAAAAKAEGATVTQLDADRFLVNNTAWVNYAGAVHPL